MCKKKKTSLQWLKLLFPLLLLLSLSIFPANGLTRDGALLLSFKYAITGDPLSLLSSWYFNDDTPCNWRGVTCSSSDGRITALSLPNSRLNGSIPSDLGFLDQLQTLNLTSNSLNGSIPADLFRATQLRVLDLSGNHLSGELSEKIGELQSLQILDLSGNNLTGKLPGHLTGIGNLSVISLRSNGFSGWIPSGLGRVRVLDLSSNSINGSLPDEFGGQIIQYLNISGNRLSGEIPSGFGRDIPANSTLDFSNNNFTGEIPNSSLFLGQKKASFSGNPGLCGGPLPHTCSISISPSPTSSPAISSKTKQYFKTEPAESVAVSPPGNQVDHEKSGKSRLKPLTIAAIVAGDLAGIAILAVVLLIVHRSRRNRKASTRVDRAWSSPSPSTTTSSETKGIAKWSCIRKTKGGGDVESSYSSSSEEEETTKGSQNAAFRSKEVRNEEQRGTLVTVDGEELEVETLLKAAAYILGASGPSILYKAVLEDGSALAVRRVGEGVAAAERLKEFESQVRLVAKVSGGHPNMVRIRGFYWGPDEKLLIYEFVPNGSLANARGYRKPGSSSPSHLPWESRTKIAKGVARALAYLHEKKHVHGNLKPTNILLDGDAHPKLADFGLDRLSPSSSRPGYSSTRHFGSKRSTASRESFQDFNPGATPSPSSSSIGCASPYHPPESLRSLQRPTAKWDVYAFGVLLLELVTGRVVQGPDDAAAWLAGVTAGDNDNDNARVLRFADVAIRADLEGKEEVLMTCLRLGCSCVGSAPQKRPSMKDALQVLDNLPDFSSPLPYF